MESPVSIWCFTTPVLLRFAGPVEKMSAYSCNNVFSAVLCLLVRFRESKSNLLNIFGFVLGEGAAGLGWLHSTGSRTLSSNSLKVPIELFLYRVTGVGDGLTRGIVTVLSFRRASLLGTSK